MGEASQVTRFQATIDATVLDSTLQVLDAIADEALFQLRPDSLFVRVIDAAEVAMVETDHDSRNGFGRNRPGTPAPEEGQDASRADAHERPHPGATPVRADSEYPGQHGDDGADPGVLHCRPDRLSQRDAGPAGRQRDAEVGRDDVPVYVVRETSVGSRSSLRTGDAAPDGGTAVVARDEVESLGSREEASGRVHLDELHVGLLGERRVAFGAVCHESVF